MDVSALVAGTLLLLLIAWDVFVTVFSLRGAGPLTSGWTTLLWRTLLAAHERRACHRTLSYIGPGMLAATVVTWYGLLCIGWYLVFASSDTSAIDSATGEAVEGLRKLYFVTVTATSIGYGDVTPSGFPWTLLGSMAGASAAIILTVSLSYVLSVTVAGIDRKLLAQKITRLGADVPELVEQLASRDNDGVIQPHLVDLANGLDAYAHRHLAYPILHYFHDAEVERSASRAILMLSDAMFLMEASPDLQAPAPAVRRLLRASMDAYRTHTRLGLRGDVEVRDGAALPSALAQAADALGTNADAVRRRFLERYAEERSALVSLCAEDGWPEAV